VGSYKKRVWNGSVPLSIYRLHSVDCRVHKLKLSVSEKKYFTNCECPIWLTGTTGREKYPRQALGLRDWAAAEAKLRSLTADSKDETVHGPKLSHCIERYLDARDDVKPKTLAQYKLLPGRLKDFAQNKNKYFIRELTIDLLEDFKTCGLAGLAGTSKGTSLAKLAHFLREPCRRRWITESLVDKIRRHKEVALILDTAAKLNGGTTGYAKKAKTSRLLIELMLETGLRVSDAVKYDPARCQKSKFLWIYSFHPRKARKNEAPKTLDVYLTNRLQQRLQARALVSVQLLNKCILVRQKCLTPSCSLPILIWPVCCADWRANRMNSPLFPLSSEPGRATPSGGRWARPRRT
jgi:hypothetical protein